MEISKTDSKTTSSRRTRPAKTALSKDIIINTGLYLLEKEGLSGLSLRKIASELETGAASLYVYFKNLDSLLDMMLDRSISDLDYCFNENQGWSEKLTELLIRYSKILTDKPGLGQLSVSTVLSGQNFLKLSEEILKLMADGCITGHKAAWAVDLLLLYCTSFAGEIDLRRQQPFMISRITDAIELAESESYPNIFSLKKELVSGDIFSRHRWALKILINGISIGDHPSLKS